MNHRRTLLFLAAIFGLAALSVSGGCVVGALAGAMAESYRKSSTHEVKAEYTGLQGKSFAVVVSVDRVIQATDPNLVSRLAGAITARFANTEHTGASGFVPPDRVLKFQYNNPGWTAWTYQRLADEFTVERLILVEVSEYRLNEPGNAYLWDGVMSGRIGVVEADSAAPDDFAFSRDVQVRFPNEKGISSREMSAQVVRTRLETRFIDRTTWLMYDHQEPYYPEY